MQDARKLAIKLYGKTLWEAFLSKFKFWEEPYEAVDRVLPAKGTVLDLGCGEGLLANYLALSSDKRKIIGYEIASERLEHAKKGVKNTTFKVVNITQGKFPQSDNVVLFHVLHHLPGRQSQQDVIEKVKKCLNKNGKLVIVEVHVKPTIKYLAAWFADHFLVPWVFEKRFYTKAYFRKEKDWISLLKKLGFKIKATEETKGRPFPNIIFECTKN